MENQDWTHDGEERKIQVNVDSLFIFNSLITFLNSMDVLLGKAESALLFLNDETSNTLDYEGEALVLQDIKQYLTECAEIEVLVEPIILTYIDFFEEDEADDCSEIIDRQCLLLSTKDLLTEDFLISTASHNNKNKLNNILKDIGGIENIC